MDEEEGMSRGGQMSDNGRGSCEGRWMMAEKGMSKGGRWSGGQTSAGGRSSGG